MIITDKIRIIVKIICLVILIALCVLIYLNGKDLKCSSCTIGFENTQVNGLNYNQFNVSIERLYNEFINDSCPLIYNKDGGFLWNSIS